MAEECGGAAARRVASADGASAASALGSTQSYCFSSTQSYCFTPEVTTADDGRARGVDSAERRRIRWGARALLWNASSLKSVRCCGRMLHNDAIGDPNDGQGVGIRCRMVDGRAVASYQNLMTCGSVWACPRCSAVIAHTRAEEIGAAVRECCRRGGRVYMLTLTMRHTRRDALSELWDALSVGWRSTFGGRSWTGQRARSTVRRGRSVVLAPVMGDAERFGVAGLVRVVEATYGRPAEGGHGWHLHVHALIFSMSGLSAGLVSNLGAVLGTDVDRSWLGRNVFASRIYQRWSAGLVKADCRMPGSVAVDVREVADDGAEYVGRYLSKATYDVARRIGLELGAGSSTKDARVERNKTPFELLAELADSVDARGFGIRTPRRWSVVSAHDGDWAVIDSDSGEVVNVAPPGEWRIWHEWELASKGRRQIIWSRRRGEPDSERELMWNALLDARGYTAEVSDEEVAAEEVGGEALGEIRRSDWYRVVMWRPALITAVLEVAEMDGVHGLSRLLSEFGVELVQRPPPECKKFRSVARR
jgi:hypothetical protein